MAGDMECFEVIRQGWVGSDGAQAAYRGIKVLRDVENSWVGTRTLWNQHAYSVSNVCGDNGAAHPGRATATSPPTRPQLVSALPQQLPTEHPGLGIFDAPDATIAALGIVCAGR